MTDLKHIQTQDALPVVLITLNRPEQRNALSTGLMREMIAALEEQSARADCRVIILRGAGQAFSAGHDLKEMLNRSHDDEREIFNVCVDLMQTIQRIPQPVIASVHALATAAGCQLVATCDLAIASENAKFATPGVKIGLFCSTPQVALSRNIGRKRAMEMLLTGRTIDARTAAEWGLVNRVVAPEKLDAEVMELAKQIANASPLTLKTGKQSFYRQIDTDQTSAYDAMAQTMADAAMTCDAQEGIGAFIEKRAPVWQGK